MLEIAVISDGAGILVCILDGGAETPPALELDGEGPYCRDFDDAVFDGEGPYCRDFDDAVFERVKNVPEEVGRPPGRVILLKGMHECGIRGPPPYMAKDAEKKNKKEDTK